MAKQLLVLIERRNWLRARIDAKRTVGRETQWDEREMDALCWAIEILLFPPSPPTLRTRLRAFLARSFRSPLSAFRFSS